MKNSIRTIAFLFCLLVGPAWADVQPRSDFQFSGFETLAIQDRGRVKPFQTFAKESVLYITGKSTWNGMSAVEVVLGWLIAFEAEWETEPFIRIDHQGLKTKVGLEPSRKYFTPEEVRTNPEFQKLVSEAISKERRRELLSEVEKKAKQVQNQRGLLESIVSGSGLSILPNPLGVDKDWYSLASLAEGGTVPFSRTQLEQLSVSMRDVLKSFLDRNAQQWNEASLGFVQFIRNDLGASAYPKMSQIQQEIHYNELRPFRLSWILYLVAFILLLWHGVTSKKIVKTISLSVLSLGFLVHCYGFVLRCLIAERPPVTNMYESVIWVSWGCVLFAGIVYLQYKNTVILTASSVFAVVGLVLADNLPSVLDAGIHPLEPVLRSNFWLTIHVLSITLSYAAFAVSLCLGNVVIGNYLFRPTNTQASQEYSLYMYRAMQIGVILLAAGTILGGVWADYSWGRFWGWDPKEVWALVALLLYLAVLHGRFTGWLRGFGFAATTVIAFLGVLMAWYGVNFVLGVGLHSYGFGSGGVGWVSAYLFAQLAFIAVGYVRYRKAAKDQKIDRSIFPKGGGVS